MRHEAQSPTALVDRCLALRASCAFSERVVDPFAVYRYLSPTSARSTVRPRFSAPSCRASPAPRASRVEHRRPKIPPRTLPTPRTHGSPSHRAQTAPSSLSSTRRSCRHRRVRGRRTAPTTRILAQRLATGSPSDIASAPTPSMTLVTIARFSCRRI